MTGAPGDAETPLLRGKPPRRGVLRPSPGRHAAARPRRGSSSGRPPTAHGFGAQTPRPSPQSQSFSRSYGSVLPTSLTYIVLLTRGCSPWRPDAVMSTTGRERYSVLQIFKGRRGRTGHRGTCGALPAAGPYLRPGTGCPCDCVHLVALLTHPRFPPLPPLCCRILAVVARLDGSAWRAVGNSRICPVSDVGRRLILANPLFVLFPSCGCNGTFGMRCVPGGGLFENMARFTPRFRRVVALSLLLPFPCSIVNWLLLDGVDGSREGCAGGAGHPSGCKGSRTGYSSQGPVNRKPMASFSDRVEHARFALSH
eukprot:Gb_30289 [translate_table: standard]